MRRRCVVGGLCFLRINGFANERLGRDVERFVNDPRETKEKNMTIIHLIQQPPRYVTRIFHRECQFCREQKKIRWFAEPVELRVKKKMAKKTTRTNCYDSKTVRRVREKFEKNKKLKIRFEFENTVNRWKDDGRGREREM